MHPEVTAERVGVAHKKLVDHVLELGGSPELRSLAYGEGGPGVREVLNAEAMAALAQEVVNLRQALAELRKQNGKATTTPKKSQKKEAS